MSTTTLLRPWSVLVLLGAVSLSSSGCGGAAAPASTPASAGPAAPRADGESYASVRDVPWGEREYEIDDGSGTEATVRLHDGRYVRDDEDDELEVVLRDVQYGDVTNDGQEEAIVQTVVRTGGTGAFDSADVYALRDGRPTRIARIDGGDRGDGGIQSIRVVQPGQVIVSRLHSTDEDGACCPSQVIVETWQFLDGGLVHDEALDRTQPLER